MTSAGAATAVQPVLASDLVFGYPRELFRVTPAGDVVVSEGVSTTDAARAFWEAVAQMRPRPDAAALNEHSGNSGQLQQPCAAAGLNEPFGDSEQLARPDAVRGGHALHGSAEAAWRELQESGYLFSKEPFSGAHADDRATMRRVAAAVLAASPPVGALAIPEGWALVDLSDYAIVPQLPSEKMIQAGWPSGELISECFDSLGAYADLITAARAVGSGIRHGKGQLAPAAAGVPAECVYAMNTGEHDEQGHELYVLTDKHIPLSDYELLYRSAPAQPAPAPVPAPDLSRTIAQLNRMRIVLRNARAYVESFTCKSALPPVQQKMIGQIDEVLGALAHAWPTTVPSEGPLSGKYGAVLRPFVAMMERELHANAGKGDRPGWLSMDSSTALLEIYHHMGKLQRATKNADEPGIVEYAADVANMAMMLVDVCGLLPVDDATHPQPAAAKDLAAMRPRIVTAIERIVSGHGCMRVPAEETDPDLVLADVLSIIDQQAKPEMQ
ncbi:hypothetical protein XarbCFBP7604_09945 [Xanthomonas arboricola]|nr:hypothetical protein XarbCFBP7604_09945 [Xanthomonas arboricola]